MSMRGEQPNPVSPRLRAERPDLAPYAARESTSRGRVHDEPGSRFRGAFQRDRDRIVHSAAFRRLEYKTQVFVNHEGDMFRTRLTHSIEVAQIARTLARVLGLNEDLVESIALAHDLGHTPFGHAGQEALDACMREHGGFEHNLQSLRIVDVLEERYPRFPGLNLTFETREGILKHCDVRLAPTLGDLGRRFLEGTQPSLEAQLTNLADEIAYNSHDVDDGLRSGLLTIDDLMEVELFREPFQAARSEWPELPERRLIHEVVRRMIDLQATDLVEATARNLESAHPATLDTVRASTEPLVRPTEAGRARQGELKRFLRQRLYRHHRVHRMTSKAARVIRELFQAFVGDPRLLPDEARSRVRALEARDGASGRARAVADYIAGMTDRYAIAEHARVFDPVALS
ncbi:MAG: deoxyguanosinetriphosphate triphosphohydrolase [Ectothiorhodospiraceae bacterium]|nr:deoxyguanosinetriphosphate triphosphohydrolase [Ectothiorhodospiraceae bacterium]